MSRSDGKFPKVNKVTLTQIDVPDNWGICKRCVGCGKRWPDHAAFTPTPCCKQGTVREEGTPDVTWKEAVYTLKTAVFEKAYEEWNEGATDAELVWSGVMTDGEFDEEKIHEAIDEFIDDAQKEVINDE